ncbi:MAG: anaerobic ribonucleoside-triphosphate reductase [Clostridia bacterium]
MQVKVIGDKISDREIDEYVKYVSKKNPGSSLATLNIKVDGDFVDLNYEFEDIPFERIRRITGYLVGTVDRFNDAKRAEEKDRLKHSVEASLNSF